MLLDEQPVPVDQEEPLRRRARVQTGLHHSLKQQLRDAAAGRAGAEDRDALLGQRHAGHLDGGEQRAGRDRGGALDVVVEGAEPVAIAVEQPRRVVLGEVLPLQQHVGPALCDGADELLDEVVVILTPHAGVMPADVERIGQAVLVVGADVEEDRQRGVGRNAAAGGVERELADRDAHAAGALIAEPEDALAVGDDDHLGAVELRIGEDVAHAGAVRQAEEHAARLAEQPAEALATGADRRRVDDRQQLLDVLHQQGVEQRLVGVLQIAQEGVAFQIGGKAAQRREPAADLLVERADGRGQQAVQLEFGRARPR